MDILSLADRALVAYIQSQLLGSSAADNVIAAKTSVTKSLPQTVCWSHSFKTCRDEEYSGNFDVESFIEIRTDAVIKPTQSSDDPSKAAQDRVRSTFELFLARQGDTSGTALGEAITDAARASSSDLQNFTVQNCQIIEGNQGFNPKTLRDRGDAWIDVIHLEMVCCPSDVQ